MSKTWLAIVLLAALFAAGAFADDAETFQSGLAGIQVAGQTIRGVAGGGVPWVASGQVKLNPVGFLRVEVRGLLISAPGNPADGTVGPVHMVSASLTCEGAGVVAMTATFPLDNAGNAEIRERITLPATCVAPIVLVRANSQTGPWIAASGFQSMMPH